MKRRIAVLWMLGLLPWAGLHAQQTTTFRVSARVEAFCDVTAPDLAVGSYPAQGRAPRQATLRLRATCTPDSTYDIALTRGVQNSTNTVTGVGTGAEEDHTLFGGVPATQVAPPSDYADTVTVRVYY